MSAPSNYSQAAESAQQKTIQKANYVQLESLVVLKIIKHAENERAGAGDLAQGYLTGLVSSEDLRLEVTNCFPMPKLKGEDDDESLAKHQESMLKMFRHINVDYLLLGWYQSAPFGACFNEAFVESMFDYQNLIDDSIVLVYDPVKTGQGLLSIKAYRLSPEAMKLCYKDFSPDSIKKAGLTYEKLFEELPIKIKNSHLVNVALCELALSKKPGPAKQALDLGSSGSLEKCLRQLMGHVETLNQETNRFNKYIVGKQRHDALKENWLQKRNIENESRRARGEPLLPVEEEVNKMFRIPNIPSMLDGMLAASEVKAHVDHTLQVAAQNLSKLFIAESVVGSERPAAAAVSSNK